MIVLDILAINASITEGTPMKMERLIIQLPVPLKAKIDALGGQGYTASGYIRAVLKRELKNAPIGRKGR